MSFPPIHRVVTGHSPDCKAIIVSNGPLPTVVEMQSLPGLVFHEVWQTNATPAPVGNDPEATGGPTMHGPPKHGTRIRFLDFPPDGPELAEPGRMAALFEEVNNPAGLTTKVDSPHPMMHRTEAVDYATVIEGEMWLVLDREEVLLKPGSVVVQRGNDHAWANRSGKPARMLFIQIDGQYEPWLAAAYSKE